MGTKSYVKPICAPRVHSHLLVGSCVNTNEIQSPCAKKFGVSKEYVKIKDGVRKESEKIKETLSEKDKKILDEFLGNCDDSHDDH